MSQKTNEPNIHFCFPERASSILSNISLSSDFLEPAIRSSIELSPNFMMAYYYSNPVRLFGKVPLNLAEIINRIDAEKPRTGILENYDLIKTDLKDVINLFSENYPGGIGRPPED